MALNTRLFRQIVSEQVAKKIANGADSAIKKVFEAKKEEFLEKFDEHPVTQELERASINPMASSEFLDRGNLFSLIGFEQGEKPTEALREYLDHEIKINLPLKKIKVNNGKIIIETPVQIPTLDDIDKKMIGTTPDWVKGKSWVGLIQKGITGFGQFVATLLASPKPSRSGGGLEHPNKSSQLSGSVGPIKYVNELLAAFKSSIGKPK